MNMAALSPEGAAHISIDDFKKVEVRIGEIREAAPLEGTDKILRLKVSFGAEERQILSGIRAYFPEPSVLVGKKVAFVTNLEPKTIRGEISNGMILAAVGDDGSFSLLEGVPGIAPGARVR